MTPAQARKAKDAVLSFLKDHPWSNRKAILAAVRLPSQPVYQRIKGDPNFDPEQEEESQFEAPNHLTKEPLPVVYNKAYPPEYFDRSIWFPSSVQSYTACSILSRRPQRQRGFAPRGERAMDGEIQQTHAVRVATTLDTGLIDVRIEHATALNLAMAHNAVPVVELIQITNRTQESLEDLRLHVELRPGVSEPWETRVAQIGPASTYNLEAPDIPLHLDRVANASEREPLQLWVEATCGVEPVLRQIHRFELLAYNEWNGSSTLPQLLAAFVQPNHPAVSEVLTRTKDVLERQTGDPSLSGYQSPAPARVRATTMALYTALQELEITYVNPPASFEETGQKIRTPEQILQDRMGTCLDLSVLVASCLEQIGLHPWVVLVKGHALPGVWLVEDNMAFASTDDPLQLLKFGELDGICLFDASTMVVKPRVPFERAERVARSYLEDPRQFCCAVDIRAARVERILPLPSRVSRESYMVIAAAPAAAAQAPAVPPTVPTSPSRPQASRSTEAEVARITRWKERLLDLSLRNRLLNFRETEKTIPLECPDVARMEDALALGQAFQILSKPDVLSEGDPRNARLLDAKTGEDTRKAFLLDQLGKYRLHSTLAPKDLDRRQLEIARTSRLSLEESGVNTLYLGVGCLAWYENESSDQTRLAPLILIPVEITRASARDPFQLQRIDEETRINITLLEKLRKDHGIEIPELADEIPMDDAGVDVPLILRLFRVAVLNLQRWHVEERAFLGHFSFTKFLMWNDLEQGAGALLKSDVIQHLVGGAMNPFPDQGAFPRPDCLDEERSPSETFCPLDADSTQLAAVFSAEDGKTFILEGPPGTGKSQTITNLISQCLAKGKTVLFVSEKMAALEVVHRRLVAVGLGEFCLELHSNKARKRVVLERLGRSWDALGAESPADHGDAGDLEKLRQRLNSYVEALHLPRPLGRSAFQVTSLIIGLKDAPQAAIGFDVSPHELTREQFKSLIEAVQRAQAAAGPLGDVKLHPWRAAQQTEWHHSSQHEVMTTVRDLDAAADVVAERASSCAKVLQADEYPMSWTELCDHRKLAQLLLESPNPPAGMLEGTGWPTTKADVLDWIDHGKRRDRLTAEISERYETDQLLELDLPALHSRFRRWSTAFFLFAFFMLLFARLALRKVVKQGRPLVQNRQITEDLAKALLLKREGQHLAGVESDARRRLGEHWIARKGSERWDRLERLVRWVDEFRGSLSAFVARSRSSHVDEGQRTRILLLADDESPVRVEGSGARRALEDYVAAFDAFRSVKVRLVGSLHLDEVLAWGGDDEPAHLDRVRERTRNWLRSEGQLRDWCHFVKMRDEAVEMGLRPLMKAHGDGAVPTDQLTRTFERSLYEWWLDGVTRQDPSLCAFHSTEHSRLICKFVDLDEKVRDLTKEIVRARLAERMPSPSTGAVAKSEMGILLRELQKKTRHIPIRKLFAQIPSLLRRLKPCLLMSPLSVAQYLGTDYSPFDLVVFDEASQIPTHDAIGAIGRGRQLIVVGDTKQLPPTTFFSRGSDDDAIPDENEIDELESILDECQASGLPRLRLGWHYRSRHESLITFSNYHYYDNALNTFPSSTESREVLGVSWQHIPNGHYDKGKTRTNKAEAEAVVAEVVKRLLDPDLQKWSIGVVTFSMAQQRLIEDLLDEARRARPEMEPFFGSAVQEPLFIKNLENVQGDERDVMLFSVCYGPDLNGLVSMNFGPLNRNGGERRLNVAVTRARFQLIVFSTLTADQIDLKRTRAVGVRHLKTFLNYAARGPRAIAEASVPGGGEDFDSPFEAAVCRELTTRGWDVHCQVGCSGYRIDLAVVHPELPGKYLLGIECDGANYHSAKCARDRDRLRQIVLEGLGWKLHRVWSTDWWHDPNREVERIEEALQHARTNHSSMTSGGAWAERAEMPVPPDVEKVPAARKTGRQALYAQLPKMTTDTAEIQQEVGEPYPVIPTRGQLGGPEDFYLDALNGAIISELKMIIRREAPVHLQMLGRRVLSLFDLKRTTARALHRIEQLLQRTGTERSGDFLWNNRLHRESYSTFRRQGEHPEQQRKAAEIAPEEVANAALVVLQQNISMDVGVLAKETGRLLGFAKMGRQVEMAMLEGIAALQSQGKCRITGERVELV